jgi:hypothetical protein
MNERKTPQTIRSERVNLGYLSRKNSKATNVTEITRLKTGYCRQVFLSKW